MASSIAKAGLSVRSIRPDVQVKCTFKDPFVQSVASVHDDRSRLLRHGSHLPYRQTASATRAGLAEPFRESEVCHRR